MTTLPMAPLAPCCPRALPASRCVSPPPAPPPGVKPRSAGTWVRSDAPGFAEAPPEPPKGHDPPSPELAVFTSPALPLCPVYKMVEGMRCESDGIPPGPPGKYPAFGNPRPPSPPPAVIVRFTMEDDDVRHGPTKIVSCPFSPSLSLSMAIPPPPPFPTTPV